MNSIRSYSTVNDDNDNGNDSDEETSYRPSNLSSNVSSPHSPHSSRNLSSTSSSITNHPYLSFPQIIIIGVILTIIQQYSLNYKFITFPFISIIIISLSYFTIKYNNNKLNFSINYYKLKFALIIYNFKKLANNGPQLDIWSIIMIILLLTWLLTIWKFGISFILWCFVLWVYNLNDNIEEISNENITDSPPIITSNEQLNPSLLYHILERKILVLEKHINKLENDKLQQNILIYTLKHTLNEKIQNLEKHSKQRDQTTQSNLIQLTNILQSFRSRKTSRLEIFKMYLKKFLILILPNWVIRILKFLKREMLMIFKFKKKL